MKIPVSDISIRHSACRCGLAAIICLGAATSLLAAESGESVGSTVASPQTLRLMDYQVGPADTITVSVRGHDEVGRTITVRPDGMVSLPLVGELMAAGKTPSQLQEVMADRLQQFINIQDSEVSITIDEVQSFQVSVLGEVREPGRFQFQSRVTVLDALAQAGGLTEFASRPDIVVLRPTEHGMERIGFNYQRALNASGDEGLIYIYPGDTVVVP